MKTKRTERGWPGHFCCATDCLFRRNTLLERRNKRIIVSTVGNMHLRGEGKMQEIGAERYYETMTFMAEKNGPYWDAGASEMEWCEGICASSPEKLPADADNQADKMHERVVRKVLRYLQTAKEIKEAI